MSLAYLNLTLEKSVQRAAKELSEISSSPRLDAEVLLAFLLGGSRTSLHINFDKVLPEDIAERFEELVEKRKSSLPIAYIVGEKEFFGLNFKVNSDVLVPRPETEIIVEKAIAFLKEKEGKLKVLDLGTGSGCISVSLGYALRELKKDFKIIAVDISENALKVANSNIVTYQLSDEIQTIQSSWFDNIKENNFDLIVSNPPYIATVESSLPKELNFEPQNALYSGLEGMNDIENILSGVTQYLKKDGIFICETGENQVDLISKYFNSLKIKNRSISFYQDLAGKERGFVVK